MTFGEAIKARRHALGMTLQTVADAALTSKGHLSDIERGVVDTTIGTGNRIAAALGLSLKTLLS